MSKPVHTKVTRLPKLEPAFMEALESIALEERWTTQELLAAIKKQPGASLAAKARLYALSHYRDKTPPRGFAEDSAAPLEAALRQVRTHKTAAKKVRKR